MFYFAYLITTLYYFWRYRSLNPFGTVRKSWTILLTLIGFDGYLTPVINNYYLLGEWFLGGILVMYCLFPILRWIVRKVPPVLLILIALIFEIAIIQTYQLNYPIEYFFAVRLFEFLFGMILIDSKWKITGCSAFVALIAIAILNFVYIPVSNQVYKTILMGILLFILLAYIGQYFNIKNKYVTIISSYSYAIFLVHHIVGEQICSR